MRIHAVGIAVLVAVLGSAGIAQGVSAQEAPPAGTMGIWFPDPADIDQPGFTLQEFLGGSIAVFADGTLCGSFVVTEPTLVVIGALGQAGACRVDGAAIDFANGHGHMFSVTTRFEADSTVGIDNFAPWAPGTAYPDYACGYFRSVGIDSVSCQMVGAPGVAPGGVGNAGLASPIGDEGRAWQVAVLLVLTIVLVGTARRVPRRAEN